MLQPNEIARIGKTKGTCPMGIIIHGELFSCQRREGGHTEAHIHAYENEDGITRVIQWYDKRQPALVERYKAEIKQELDEMGQHLAALDAEHKKRMQVLAITDTKIKKNPYVKTLILEETVKLLQELNSITEAYHIQRKQIMQLNESRHELHKLLDATRKSKKATEQKCRKYEKALEGMRFLLSPDSETEDD